MGAVSPAGWGVAALRQAVAGGTPLPLEMLVRPGWKESIAVRSVPRPLASPAFLAHPRLRRASPFSHHTLAAALEALGAEVDEVQAGRLRLGIIVCTMAGGVGYSRRFYEEVLREPGTASPVLFPETVFNAPASHLAAFLNSGAINYSLVGDEGTFLQGLALAAQWLDGGRVDGCVVVGTEELDWIVADALRLFQKSAVYAGGAGALFLKNTRSGIRLAAITDSFPFTKSQSRRAAAHNMRYQLEDSGPFEFLCDSTAEHSIWQNWPGNRLTPKTLLGEAFNAAAAWQCVLACDAVQETKISGACASVVGANQQAIGARFAKTGLPTA
jgi:hypothetical protein